jgi:hypothetical protein
MVGVISGRGFGNRPHTPQQLIKKGGPQIADLERPAVTILWCMATAVPGKAGPTDTRKKGGTHTH